MPSGSAAVPPARGIFPRPLPRRFFVAGFTAFLLFVGTTGTAAVVTLLRAREALSDGGLLDEKAGQEEPDEQVAPGCDKPGADRARCGRRRMRDPVATGLRHVTGGDVPDEHGNFPDVVAEPEEQGDEEAQPTAAAEPRAGRAAERADTDSADTASADTDSADTDSADTASAGRQPGATTTSATTAAAPPERNAPAGSSATPAGGSVIPAIPEPMAARPARPTGDPAAAASGQGPTGREVVRKLALALQEVEGMGREAGAVTHAVANLEDRLREARAALDAYRARTFEGAAGESARKLMQKCDAVAGRLQRAALGLKDAARRAMNRAEADLDDPFAAPSQLIDQAAADLRTLEQDAAAAP